MATCPDCGEIVMEGDPYCTNCGATLRWVDDEKTSSNSYHVPTPEEHMRQFARYYRDFLKYARSETDDKRAIKNYKSAIDSARSYNIWANKFGCGGGAIPEDSHLLEPSDVERCSRIHYRNMGKASIFNDCGEICDTCEDILKRTGNSSEIYKNKRKMEDDLKVKREISARERESHSIIQLRQQYYKYLRKANDAVQRDAPRYAIKNYRAAVETHENYFSKDYEKHDSHDAKIMPQPPERLTDEARYYLLELYKKTHPLISSSKMSSEINSEVVSLLSGLHRDDLERADDEVDGIVRRKKLKRQRQKEQVEEVIVDGIVEVRKALDRIKR